MKIVNRGRGTGKTTMLIHTSYITGYPIVVYDENRAVQVREQAKALGCDGITVVSYENIRVCHPTQRVGLLVDEATDLMEIAMQRLLGDEIVGCTMTVPMEKLPMEKEADNEDN